MKRAKAVAHRAYAPYSNFPVGSAVVDDRGRVFVGANVENASFGLTMCAERAAAYAAIAGGAKSIAAVAIASGLGQAITPCGACRQVLAELCRPGAQIFCDDGNGSHVTYVVEDILPDAFLPSSLIGTSPKKVGRGRKEPL